MKITGSTPNDLNEIFRLYASATAYQKTKFNSHWPTFEKSLVEREIKENRQWKLMDQSEIACVWATTFDDPYIWEERNVTPAVYLHRIATNPNFKGRKLLLKVIDWAKQYAKESNKKMVRLDTVGNNKELIRYYELCGFTFLGLSALKNTANLPEHYHNASVSLFELKV